MTTRMTAARAESLAGRVQRAISGIGMACSTRTTARLSCRIRPARKSLDL